MGHNPIPPQKVLTLLETAKLSYVYGWITIEEMEEQVTHLIATGSEDYRLPMQAPPKPTDSLASVTR